MSERTELGKIESIRFGIGGYNEAMIGIGFTLSFGSSGCSDWKGPFDPNIIECTDDCKWDEKYRNEQMVEVMRFVSDLLHKAKVRQVTDLAGIPVEVVTENNTLKSWRILEEVL